MKKESENMLKTILPRELKLLLDSEEVYAVIDVREKNEYESGQIFGATSVPRRLLESQIPVLIPIKHTKVILYDDDSARSILAAGMLKNNGYTNVKYLLGGLNNWKISSYPLVKGVHVLSKSFGEIVGEIQDVIPTLSPIELKHRMDISPEDYIIIEVRPVDEVLKTGSIPGAINIPGVELPLKINDFIKSGKNIVTTCAGRTRGFIACATLKKMGIKKVYDLNNGTLGWQLAGFQLEQEILQGDPPSIESKEKAKEVATRLAKTQGIQLISVEIFEKMRHNSNKETLYIIDVRSIEEYELMGHIADSISMPGGQAIQNTDDIIAVNKANIVFVCDNGTRSIITAYWYKRMGFSNVYVIDGGLSSWNHFDYELVRGVPQSYPLGFIKIFDTVKKIDANKLKSALDKEPNIIIIDVSDSRSFAEGHISKAHWLPRGRLESRISEVVKDKRLPLIITSQDQYEAIFAANTLYELGFENVRALADGNQSWKQAGYYLVRGLDGIRPDDWRVMLTEYGQDEATKYFDWEESLTHLSEYMSYFRRKGVLK